MRTARTRCKALWAACMCFLVTFGCGEDPTTPPPDDGLIVDGESFMTAVAKAYGNRDLEQFEAFLANDPSSNAVFSFRVTDASGSTQSTWDFETEMSIHRRMFDPGQIPATDPPLDPELWLTSVSVTLQPREAFVERTDLYASDSNPAGLDPARWRATSALYKADAFFQPQGDTWFFVDGDAEFIVIEDRMKDVGNTGKFLLLSWSDPCVLPRVQSRECWSSVKMLYAK